MKKLYFAYGSNMDQERLESRVGAVKKIGVTNLYGWKLIFNCGSKRNRYANIAMTSNYNDIVEGVVYEMDEDQIRKLDMFEGAPWAYQRFVYPFSKRRDMYIYLCINPAYVPNPKALPTKEYMMYIIKGCIDNGLERTQYILQAMLKGTQIV